MNRIIIGYIGILFIFIGIATFINPSFYHSVYGVTINFSNVKWPFFILSTGFGVICVYVAISKKYLGDRVEYWICPMCQETFKLSGSKKHNCPECKVPLEKLKGFYERHPGLKSDKKENGGVPGTKNGGQTPIKTKQY